MSVRVHPEQLDFDQLLECEQFALLAAELGHRRQLVGHGGAARLMRELIKRGLPEHALVPAARLVVELDLEGARPLGGVVSELGRTPPIPRIALTREEASASLGIGLDSFERYVQPNIRMIRWGRLRLVPVAELQRFADEAAERTLR